MAVGERDAARLAGPLRQLFDQAVRVDGVRIPPSLMEFLEACEAAKARRDDRQDVPQTEHAVAVGAEHAASSPRVEREPLSVREIADRLDIGDRAVRQRIERKTLRARKVGGQWFVDPDDLKEYEESRINGSPDR